MSLREESVLTGFADTDHAVVATVCANEDGELVFIVGPSFHKAGVLKARHREWMHSKLDEWIDEQLNKEQA